MFEPQFLGRAHLAQPDAQSVGRNWWIHHILETRAYLQAALNKDMPAAVFAMLELWKVVLDWQRLTGKPIAGILMAEHTALAKLLVDCFSRGEGDACTTTAADALARNVGAQGSIFPSRFVELFRKHVEITGQYVGDRAKGDLTAFEKHFAQAIENGRELGDFMDQVFLK